MAIRDISQPKLGEIKKGTDIGYKSQAKCIWQACISCGKERWVSLRHNQPRSLRCKECAKNGIGNWHWESGRSKTSYGYVLIWLDSKDFFYPMARISGYVLEHRLVMAHHLGRCLQIWEIVHHKNHIKTDNRLENLQLISDDRHKQITILEMKIDKLIEGQRELKSEIRLLRLENKQLKERIC